MVGAKPAIAGWGFRTSRSKLRGLGVPVFAQPPFTATAEIVRYWLNSSGLTLRLPAGWSSGGSVLDLGV
jgi:hypothetical protein